MGKIGLAICVLAAVVLYGTEENVLFWLAIAATVILFFSGLAISYIVAEPEMKSFRDTVKEMELDGATNEEVKEFMNQPTEPAAYDYKDVPNWIPAIGWLALITGSLKKSIKSNCKTTTTTGHQCLYKSKICTFTVVVRFAKKIPPTKGG